MEQRLRSRGSVQIVTEGAQPAAAKVLDVSPSGIGIESTMALECGTAVRLDCYGVIAEGIVRHCRPVVDRYDRFVIGIALVPPDGLPAAE
jgi:PilZ domain